MHDILKKTATFANDLVETVGWALRRMDSPGRNTDREKVIGKTAEVSVAIEPGKVGQILVVLGGTIQQYSARGKMGCDRFAKGSTVEISEIGNHMMYVKPVDEVSPSGEIIAF